MKNCQPLFDEPEKPQNLTPPPPTTLPHAIARVAVPKHRRNGKIARLAKPIRDRINRMLDDGLPFTAIIDQLGDVGHGLNPQNLTNWVRGGYQDYLQEQETVDRAKAQMQFVIGLLRETGDTDPDRDPDRIQHAANLVAAHHLFNAMLEHGEEALRRMLNSRPQRYLTLINTLCNISTTALRLDKNQVRNHPPPVFSQPPKVRPPHPSTPGSSSPIKPNQGDSSP